MATKTQINRSGRQEADQKLIDGLTKHAQTIPSLLIGGTSQPPSAIIAVLQARIASANAVLPTRAAWQSMVQGDRDERAETKTLVSGLRQALQVAFAGAIETLADFVRASRLSSRCPRR